MKSSCKNDVPIALILEIVLPIIGAILIGVAIIFGVPPIRRRVFPYRDRKRVQVPYSHRAGNENRRR